MSKVINAQNRFKRQPDVKETISQLVCQQLTLGQLRAIRDGLSSCSLDWYGDMVYIDIGDVYTEIAERGE